MLAAAAAVVAVGNVGQQAKEPLPVVTSDQNE
jgi:hypothetical protein